MSARGAVGGRHTAAPRHRVPAVGLVSAAVVVALLVALATSHGTAALWNARGSAVGGGVVRSGTAAVTAGALPAMYQTPLGPGGATTGAFSVANTGSVPLSMRVTVSSTKVSYASPTPDATVLGSLTFHLAAVSSASACKAGLAGAGGPIATFDTGAGYYTLPAGASAWACIEVDLASNAPQSVSGAVVDFVVTVSGTQVAS